MPIVEQAWENYTRKLLECAALEETWTLKVDVCDGAKQHMHELACMGHAANCQCASNFGHEYHTTWSQEQFDADHIKEYCTAQFDLSNDKKTSGSGTAITETKDGIVT